MKSVRWHTGGIAVLALWLVVSLVRFQGPPDPPEFADAPADSGVGHLDGTWVVRSARFDGTEIPAAVVAAITFVFNDGLVTMNGGFAADGDGYIPVTGERRYKIAAGAADAGETPERVRGPRYVLAARADDASGAIDLHPADSDRSGLGCIPGLYKIDRGTLTLVLNFAGPRPTSLDADAESVGRFVCERQVDVR